MSENERMAVLEQRVKQLEADEDRQRNWRMRYIGWLVSPSVALFLAGLTLWAAVHYQILPEIDDIKSSLKSIGNELGEIYDKIEEHH